MSLIQLRSHNEAPKRQVPDSYTFSRQSGETQSVWGQWTKKPVDKIACLPYIFKYYWTKLLVWRRPFWSVKSELDTSQDVELANRPSGFSLLIFRTPKSEKAAVIGKYQLCRHKKKVNTPKRAQSWRQYRIQTATFSRYDCKDLNVVPTKKQVTAHPKLRLEAMLVCLVLTSNEKP